MQMTQHSDDAGYGDRAHVTNGECWCNPKRIKVDGADSVHFVESETPPVPPQPVVELDPNRTMRAIVASALIHVRNKIKTASNIENESQAVVVELINNEIDNWPLDDPLYGHDTLPQWLHNRFVTQQGVQGPAWDGLHESERKYWTYQAAAVRRAVGRGGFNVRKPAETTAPKAAPRTPGYDGPEGTEWPGGKAVL